VKALMLVLALLSPVTQLDARVQQAVQSHRQGWLERPMRAASDIGKPLVVVGTLLAIAVLDAAEGVTVARVALVAAAVVNGVVEGLKRITDRTRPDGEHNPGNASFPSSHAANALAFAVLLSRRWPRGAAAFWIGALFVAASRMYLNRHFLSDVVVGAALGAGLAFAVAQAMHWRVARGALRPQPERAARG
jgi:undecaprenyl-diphosphatase